MSSQRRRLFERICALVGNPPLRNVDSGEGWPGVADLVTGLGTVRVAMHVSRVGSHSRAEHEMRFQNPADSAPVVSPRGCLPILVVTDARSRIGREARFSILFHKRVLTEAAARQWGEYVSDSGERIIAMHPKLLPIFAEGLKSNALPDASSLVNVAAAAGLDDDGDEPAAARARRFASRLVRSVVFSRNVRTAYEHKCSMCGLGIDLVQGAHIYPASADGSHDKVWNGIALCHNHHAAFDKHMIWVDPTNYRVHFRPDILSKALLDPAVQAFKDNTRPNLHLPAAAHQKPRIDMLTKRYEYYRDDYQWL